MLSCCQIIFPTAIKQVIYGQFTFVANMWFEGVILPIFFASLIIFIRLCSVGRSYDDNKTMTVSKYKCHANWSVFFCTKVLFSWYHYGKALNWVGTLLSESFISFLFALQKSTITTTIITITTTTWSKTTTKQQICNQLFLDFSFAIIDYWWFTFYVFSCIYIYAYQYLWKRVKDRIHRCRLEPTLDFAWRHKFFDPTVSTMMMPPYDEP